MKTFLKRERRKNREKYRVKQTNSRNSNFLRMCVRKTCKHIYISIINDKNSNTLMAFSSLNKEMIKENIKGYNITGAIKIGEEAAKLAASKGLYNMVVEKGGKKYHGVIKALLEKFFETLNFKKSENTTKKEEINEYNSH